ncbi:isoleucyl-tRNA synthetase [Pedobacter psychroterrae]|uniref:isoleucyl-tRNA synthetase n=1 Tax=Pedobacter psychroterrae TaxID=2530453 RepID=UPI00197E368F|nr:isoleucyl-tRNA synthetase [Pedobacter psychroterrae]
MIKVLKLQKALVAFILGALALVAYIIMDSNKVEGSRAMLTVSGILLMAGALMSLYPILFAKKDKQGQVQLDAEKHEEMLADTENTKAASSHTESSANP